MTLACSLAITVFAAELSFLLHRAADLAILIKRDSQRSPAERTRIERGLSRSILLEFFPLVPASAVLLSLIAPAWSDLRLILSNDVAYYALLGIASYGFPFTTTKSIITRTALKILDESLGVPPANPTKGGEEEQPHEDK